MAFVSGLSGLEGGEREGRGTSKEGSMVADGTDGPGRHAGCLSGLHSLNCSIQLVINKLDRKLHTYWLQVCKHNKKFDLEYQIWTSQYFGREALVRSFDCCSSGSIKQHCISLEVWTLHEQGRQETASFREGERRPSGAKLLLSLPPSFPFSFGRERATAL